MSHKTNSQVSDTHRLVEGSGSVQLPTNATPHQQAIELVNRVADSRLPPQTSAPPASAQAPPPVALPEPPETGGSQ